MKVDKQFLAWKHIGIEQAAGKLAGKQTYIFFSCHQKILRIEMRSFLDHLSVCGTTWFAFHQLFFLEHMSM